MTSDPFGRFRDECYKVLSSSMTLAFPRVELEIPPLDIPPTLLFGDLASSIGFELAKETNLKPLEVFKILVENAAIKNLIYLKSISVGGAGYINFHADRPKLTKDTLENTKKLDSLYGYVKTNNPARIIVEHTSVNPGGPIHVGSARNSVIGDSLARILTARGHHVSRHFYIDDVGKQIAVLSYGYIKLNKPKPTGKPDHWIGLVYADTSSIIETKKLRSEIQRYESAIINDKELNTFREQLEDWEGAASKLRTRNPKLFKILLKNL